MGNIDIDPMFVDPVGGDWRINSGSLCIDAGTNAVVPTDVTTDLAGSPRFIDDLSMPDSGAGVAPIVDMGAYERTFRCVADVDDGSGTGTPDSGVTVDDLLYYLSIFEAGLLDADVDNGTFTNTPDGGVTIDDLLYYLIRFEAGC